MTNTWSQRIADAWLDAAARSTSASLDIDEDMERIRRLATARRYHRMGVLVRRFAEGQEKAA